MRGACVSCDELCKDLKEILVDDKWEKILKHHSKWMSDVPILLNAQYDVGKVDACFNTAFLPWRSRLVGLYARAKESSQACPYAYPA